MKTAVNESAHKTTLRKKLIPLIVVFALLIVSGIVYKLSSGSSISLKGRSPGNLRIARRRRGFLKLTWDKASQEVTSINLIDNESQKTSIVKAEANHVQLHGLIPGKSYRYSFNYSDGSKSQERKIHGPETELTMKIQDYPKAPGQEAVIEFGTVSPSKLVFRYRQNGQQHTSSLPESYSKTNTFLFTPDDGVIEQLSISVLPEGGDTEEAELPIEPIVSLIETSIQSQDIEYLTRLCYSALKEQCIGKSAEQRAEIYRELLYQHHPEFGKLLTVFSFTPLTITRCQDPVSLNESLLKLIDFDMLAKTYSTVSPLRPEYFIKGPFELSDGVEDSPIPFKSTIVKEIFSNIRSNELVKRIPALLPRNLGKAACDSIVTRASIYHSRIHYHVDEYKVEFTLKADELAQAKGAKIRFSSIVFRHGYKILIQINDSPLIPFTSSKSPATSRMETTIDRATDQKHDQKSYISRMRVIPLKYLKAGKNTVTFTNHSPSGENSVFCPTMRTAHIILEKM